MAWGGKRILLPEYEGKNQIFLEETSEDCSVGPKSNKFSSSYQSWVFQAATITNGFFWPYSAFFRFKLDCSIIKYFCQF